MGTKSRFTAVLQLSMSRFCDYNGYFLCFPYAFCVFRIWADWGRGGGVSSLQRTINYLETERPIIWGDTSKWTHLTGGEHCWSLSQTEHKISNWKIIYKHFSSLCTNTFLQHSIFNYLERFRLVTIAVCESAVHGKSWQWYLIHV